MTIIKIDGYDIKCLSGSAEFLPHIVNAGNLLENNSLPDEFVLKREYLGEKKFNPRKVKLTLVNKIGEVKEKSLYNSELRKFECSVGVNEADQEYAIFGDLKTAKGWKEIIFY
ncbi:MAG: hypothetical protein NUV46_00035 [Nanoarchaeota archaeon]|nr:hypothetical protein [Nanoarchaeota archaeon]